MKMPPKDGAELIAEERSRQITAERWTPEHDDGHGSDELALAAACYALPERARMFDSARDDELVGLRVALDVRLLLWPFAGGWKPTPEDRVRELVKAGALIAAEIDRLGRLK